MKGPGIDIEKVVGPLREAGVRRGDVIGLHSRVPSLGRIIVEIYRSGGEEAVRRAADDIVEGFLAALDPQAGTLCVPTFSYCFVGRAGTRPYNPETTPSEVGLLTNVVLERPDAVRSRHPTHSVAAIGARARELVAEHERRQPLGEDSPFHRLAQWGGWICYLGTNGNTLSLLHVAEVLAGVPYADVFRYEHLGWKSAALVERPDGGAEEVPIRLCPGCSRSFHRFDSLADRAGITRKTRIYGAPVVLFKAMDALDLAVARLKEDPGFLLCARGSCPACDVAWAALD